MAERPRLHHSFHVPGEVRSWRVSRRRGSKDPELKRYQGKVAAFAKAAGCKPVSLFTGVVLRLDFVLRRPLKAKHWFPSVSDLTNMLKATEDALSGIAYHDNRQVIQANVRKRFAVGDEEPGVWVEIRYCHRPKPRQSTPPEPETASDGKT